ncbi:hypothetical protein Q73A0000_07085 [Kaistella flava (ex Peng et al. 2021)]|uniref:RNA polymerase sigma-70 region 4 domain-containing protein n=1 Tax=Kaistella flava (ex Peng et al. 2021) TaxID=2038776 RepID=A0A7M2Y7K5_9FLAO|nr:hypothetical protein [Kaistella flava (ex Peng et al. 2021)]QOW10141.1 hypothetical protein Q73A0000_07085 [Kaistella flava (ex Peng et al. 2021)]
MKNNSAKTVFSNDNNTICTISDQKIIDLTNQFYLEMSKNILDEKEYDIMSKLLIEKQSLQTVSVEYDVTKEAIRQNYKKIFFKIKSVSELVTEINALKEKKNLLYQEYLSEYKKMTKRNSEKEIFNSDRRLIDSHFPFSKRLWNMLVSLEIYTFNDLLENPLEIYPKFRGFKGSCLKEFICFIEFENLENHFDENFYEFKEKYKK